MGVCDDGLTGTGTCTCNLGYYGESCDTTADTAYLNWRTSELSSVGAHVEFELLSEGINPNVIGGAEAPAADYDDIISQEGWAYFLKIQ